MMSRRLSDLQERAAKLGLTIRTLDNDDIQFDGEKRDPNDVGPHWLAYPNGYAAHYDGGSSLAFIWDQLEQIEREAA